VQGRRPQSLTKDFGTVAGVLAQALLFDFLPADWLQLGSNEPVTPVLTGLAVLSPARDSLSGARAAAERPRPVRVRANQPGISAEVTPTSSRRAA